ncbi:hypothetical protein F0358_12885 [Empedobacter brevis]|uniref:hypothetical protein n=1 Tax=Empedobacter brevis TaxID=247 RepID=UPI00123D77A2|nr:hypothetical protein [Empedobacter brevis]QES93551.1 hypothetical protein F0358_12885 [Empedobacter brevis]
MEELKWLNKIKFCVAVYLLSFSIHAQESDYTSIYNDSIPNKMELDIRKAFIEKNYELYKIKENDQYSIYLLKGNGGFKKMKDNTGYGGLLRVLIVSHSSDIKIAFVINDHYYIERQKNKITIKKVFKLNGAGNPFLLDSNLKIKEITQFSIKKGELYFQNVHKPCEIKIRKKVNDLTIEEIFVLFTDPNFEVKASDCKLLLIYQPFSDWKINQPLDK